MSTQSRTIHLSYWDQVVLRRLLFRQKNRCLKDIERSAARGWKPEPGKMDISKVSLEHVEAMLLRIPDPGELQVVTNVGGE